MRFSLTSPRTAWLVVGLALAAAPGCGSSNAKLTGKVTYRGTALKGGTVTLIPTDDGRTWSTKIQEDGSYTFEQIRTGKYKVCVETESLKPNAAAQERSGSRPGAGIDKTRFKNEPPKGAQLPEGYRPADPFGGPADAAKRYVAIPAQYGEPDTTPLTVDVSGGTQQHDIPLS